MSVYVVVNGHNPAIGNRGIVHKNGRSFSVTDNGLLYIWDTSVKIAIYKADYWLSVEHLEETGNAES